MNKLIRLLPLAASFLFLSACHLSNDHNLSKEISPAEVSEQLLGSSLELRRNGKVQNTPELTNTYNADLFRTTDVLPEMGVELIGGLENQRRLLEKRRKKSTYKAGNLTIEREQMMETVALLQKAASDPTFNFANHLNAYQLAGKDQKGNVNFTGYFTPVIKVRAQKDSQYKYPLYTRPLDWVGEMPTRAEIDGAEVLSGMGLELAYASNPVDVYFMQVQGSGIVEYPDGKQVLFSNNGQNGHRYRSIGRYMIENGFTTPQYVSINSIRKILGEHPEWMEEVLYSNPSYVFFRPLKARPSGAGQVPLTPGYSIAVDPKYIPVGSCLLAAVPIHDKKGNFTHHEYRVLLAQDTGGAINGPGHVDLYTGIGKQAKRDAGFTHHYGGLWLLLPKEQLALMP